MSKISVLRSVKLYRAKGMAGFFAPRICRGPVVLTPPVLAQVQELLDAKRSIPEIADELGLKADTLHKAVRAGKVHSPQKKTRFRQRETVPTDLSLGGTAIDVQLAGDHTERLHIVDVMGEHRQVAVYIDDGRVLAYKTDVLVDQGNAFREKRQLELRHGDCPFEELILITAIISKSVTIA